MKRLPEIKKRVGKTKKRVGETKKWAHKIKKWVDVSLFRSPISINHSKFSYRLKVKGAPVFPILREPVFP